MHPSPEINAGNPLSECIVIFQFQDLHQFFLSTASSAQLRKPIFYKKLY